MYILFLKVSNTVSHKLLERKNEFADQYYCDYFLAPAMSEGIDRLRAEDGPEEDLAPFFSS